MQYVNQRVILGISDVLWYTIVNICSLIVAVDVSDIGFRVVPRRYAYDEASKAYFTGYDC